MTMTRENRKILFSIALFFIIIKGSLLAWKLFPCLLPAIDRTGFWPRYSVGFAFSALIGGAMIGRLVGNMQKRITDYTREEYPHIPPNRIRPFSWFPEVFGYIERPMYTASYLLGKPEFIGVWLGVKMLARWSLPRTEEDKITDNRHRYYPVLVGNALSVAYGVAGALVIKWLRRPCRFWFALAIMLTLTIGTLVLSWYEEYNSRKLTS